MCFSDIAGISPGGDLSGHSLLPLLSKSRGLFNKQHPDWVLSEYHGCNVNASTYMLRSGRWKYITYSDGLSVPPQLFGEFLAFTVQSLYAFHSNHYNLDFSVTHFSFADLSLDKEELHNVVHKFPEVKVHLDKLLRGIVDYPEVSSAVHLYNIKSFGAWREDLGGNYSQVIATLRWHVDWQRDVLANEGAIDRWMSGLS